MSPRRRTWLETECYRKDGSYGSPSDPFMKFWKIKSTNHGSHCMLYLKKKKKISPRVFVSELTALHYTITHCEGTKYIFTNFFILYTLIQNLKCNAIIARLCLCAGSACHCFNLHQFRLHWFVQEYIPSVCQSYLYYRWRHG